MVLRVHGPRLRIVWICGAAGAGKSVAAWSLFEELAAAGHRVAYVDIDQLGMLYPAAEDDPERHSMKSRALAALAPCYLAAGASVLIVSGVVDVQVGPITALPPYLDLTMFLLSPNPNVLRERILARGWAEEDAEEAVAEDALLRNAEFVDFAIDTAELSVADTLARLQEFIGELRPWSDAPRRVVTSAARIDVIVVTGARAAGSSTIGFGLAMRRWRADQRTGFVDLQQLGFISGRDGQVSSEATLAVRQLAVMHALLSERGAELLVVSGRLSVTDRALVRTTLPAARVTVVRLRADSECLESHVRARVRGSDARLAGDDLLGADRAHQERVVAAALAEQEVLDASAVDDVVLDVSGRIPADVVADVESERTGKCEQSAHGSVRADSHDTAVKPDDHRTRRLRRGQHPYQW
jgi:adenylylsulfate kinase-like enzyme